jgi:hypothetical protein
VRTIIADLISDDRSPFTPEDELSLRNMSPRALRQMRSDFLKANGRHRQPPVANLAGRDFSFGAGIMGADFARAHAQRKLAANAYCADNPVTRAQRAVTNSSDPAVQAMSANTGALAHFRSKS